MMDFDAKYSREKFPSNIPLNLHDNYSSKSRNDEFFLLEERSFSSKGTSLYQDDLINNIENFNLNEGPSSSSNPMFSLQPTTYFDQTFNSNSTFGCLQNLDFFESKPFENNHSNNNGALLPFMDNNLSSQSGGIGVLGHSHMMATPINMVSPNGLTYKGYNPFSYRDFDILKSYKPSDDEGSCTTPAADIDKVAKSLSTPMVKRGCRGRKKKINLVKGQWTIEEDRLLVELVERYGVRKWSHIAELLNGRIGKQCRERWHNHLKPDIKKDVWSEEEDRVLIKAHKEIGNKWSEMAKKLPGRTENSIKNHWNATKRRQFSRRKCRSKYPNQSSLLQDYIKSLNPEIINAGCRKKPSKPTDKNMGVNTNASSNDQNGSLDSSSRCQLEADHYDFMEVPDFNFDAQMFEESSIDSLLDCVPDEVDGNATACEIMNDPQIDFETMMEPSESKRELDLVEMINKANP